MKKKLGILSLSAVLSFSFAQAFSAAEIWSDGDWELGQPANSGGTQKTTEIWSEPTKTEIWSEPTKTEIWTEPTKTDIWTDPTKTEVWTEQNGVEPSLDLEKTGQTIDQNVSTSTALTFTILPVVQNGSVLVPLRGTLEQLGHSVVWHDKEQLVEIKKGNIVIKLKTNVKTAIINGKIEPLEAPAKMINGSVFVPLRFISQATGSKVDYDAATTKVTIDGQYYFYVDKTKQSKTETSKQQIQTTENISFTGVWEIWVPGGFATTDSTLNGDGSTTIKQEYVKGAKGKTVTINADGTYIWETVSGTVKGEWETADRGRIILTNGDMEFDWYVEKVESNQIKMYSYGMEQYGTKIK